MSYVALTALGTLALLFFAGLATGLFADLASDGGWSRTPALVEATLAHVPAVLVLGGLAVAAFGLVPRWAAAIAWLAYAVALVTGPLIGQLLDLPQWARNISPFTHSPNLPAADADVVPVVALLLIAVLLTVAGFLGFRRRDIARY
jgi:ABC-2 type transport system permease protein